MLRSHWLSFCLGRVKITVCSQPYTRNQEVEGSIRSKCFGSGQRIMLSDLYDWTYFILTGISYEDNLCTGLYMFHLWFPLAPIKNTAFYFQYKKVVEILKNSFGIRLQKPAASNNVSPWMHRSIFRSLSSSSMPALFPLSGVSQLTAREENC